MDKHQDLLKAIVKIEKPWPPDDKIGSYQDFLRHRDLIIYHQFNQTVFEQILDLALLYWTATTKVSRHSLVMAIRRYVSEQEVDVNNLISSIKIKLFELFVLTLIHSDRVPKGQREEVEKWAAQLILGVQFESPQLRQLCNFALHHPKALNRVLRYPFKSEVISTWAFENFDHPVLKLRRAEAVGWLLDLNPSFEVDTKTIRADFDYMNEMDREAVSNIVMSDVVHQLFKTDWPTDFPINNGIPVEPYEIEKKKLPPFAFGKDKVELIKRFYPVKTVYDKAADNWVPDFEALEEYYQQNQVILRKVTMVWGIAYSRIDKKQKSQLLRKHYCLETHYSIFRVATKHKLLDLLKWMAKQLD
jgi:hypothetical protein